MTGGKDQLNATDREFLNAQGLKEVEPGRWVSDFESSGPRTQAQLDGRSERGREHPGAVLSIFVAIKTESTDDFEELQTEDIDDGLDETFEKYDS